MNIERKLATIRKVSEILPIEGADSIELAKIDGWQCVVKKDEFKVNDLAIYFEIDSLLPCNEPFLFMESRGRKTLEDGTEGYRLRTIKLKGILSQGLLMPLSLFFVETNVVEGDDVTSILNIKKYEAPIPAQLRGVSRGNFPSFIRKTDEERIQNFPEYFTIYENEEFEESEKIDGTSATYYWNSGEFGICSRNINFKIDSNNDNTYFQIEQKYDIRKSLESANLNIAIQGEIAGPGIQKNRLGLKEITFFIFNIYNINIQSYLSTKERKAILDVYFSHIPHVPIISISKIFQKYPTMDLLLNHANGQSLINPDRKREGVVYKSINNIEVFNDERIISFKSISNNYLLKEE
jgi:RNA ligase (TIGR02306 family)